MWEIWLFHYNLQGDGLHRKKEWDEAIAEETEMLKKKVEGHERRIRSLNSMENRIKIQEEDEKNNVAKIDEIKYFLKNLPQWFLLAVTCDVRFKCLSVRLQAFSTMGVRLSFK